MCPNVMLGGSRDLIDGKSTGDKKKDVLMRKMSKDCYFTFFKGTKMDFGICDAQLSGSEARFGVEPTYMYERLKMIVIDWEKKISYIENGYSWGGWGTGIRATRAYYKDKKTNSKFKRFVDKWHSKIFPNMQ